MSHAPCRFRVVLDPGQSRVRVGSETSPSRLRVGSESGQSRLRVNLVFALSAGLIAVTCGGGTERQADPTRERPDLVLITIDTLRADRLGRGIMPALDALAARGVQFTQARAAVPLTLPSHVSMLTGALPPAHGVRENGTHVFAGKPPSVARQLNDVGYQTAAFVGAYVLDRRFGLADGFDHYDDQIARDPRTVLRLEAERPADVVADRALAWLAQHQGESRAKQAPVFMWVHFYDPHAPYNSSYDDDVRFTDRQLGRLLENVRAAGRDPIIVVVGDHGESLGEHGERTHGMLLYETALRVPFVVAGPGVAPDRRDDPVSLVDVAPTLLARAGLASAYEGRDALGTIADEREIYSETEYPRVAGWSPVYALLQDRWKLIQSGQHELYDLATDPGELKNVAAERRSIVSVMSARLEAFRSTAGAAARQQAPPEVADRLRALGYVAGRLTAPRPGDGPNPADHIAVWGEFEAALSDLTAGNPIAAAGRLEPLVKKYPDAPVFQSTYARVLMETGSIDAALRTYRRAVERWPNDPTLFHDLAVAAREAGRAEEAMRAEKAAIVLAPDLPSAHNGVGLLMTDAERHGEAAQAFEQAVKADPTNAEYWVNLGNARRALREMDAAADAYRRAAEIDPRSSDAANGLGVLLVQQQRPADAIPWFRRALEASPDFVEARLNLGIAYQESGQRDLARAAYSEVLARAPSSAPERRAAADLLRSLER
jgi:arylsulfatase A-like enzyme/Tfp pilus assembly protein PilF